jgi:hypothetical protein
MLPIVDGTFAKAQKPFSLTLTVRFKIFIVQLSSISNEKDNEE